MTAPNGPSQQECVRGSMREAGLTANQITCSELHGSSERSISIYFLLQSYANGILFRSFQNISSCFR